MTAIDIVKEYFPDVDDETASDIAWERTGFPHFWNIPADGKTVEECFRKQLKEFAESIRKAEKREE